MAEIGFSVILTERYQGDYPSLLQDMLGEGCSAIELHTPERFPDWQSLAGLIQKFGYVAIHAPSAFNPEDTEAISYYQELAAGVDAQTLTVHPSRNQNIRGLVRAFPGLVAIENMDADDRKNDFGQNVVDLTKVFKDAPEAGFVLDVNHVLTNDYELGLGYKLLASFAYRLRHIHVSAHEGHRPLKPHTTYHDSEQNHTLRLVQPGVPIIIESLGIEDIDSDWRKEKAHIENVLGRAA